MLLAIDVGNTTTVIAVAIGDEDAWGPTWRLVSDRNLTSDDWTVKVGALARSAEVDLGRVDAVVISSVVPSMTTTLERWSRTHVGIEPMIVSCDLELGVRLLVDTPAELGTDRLCNVEAAWDRLRAAAIIVDVGTATKVEALTASGEYLGGSIAVGLSLSLEALAGRAARLYSVPLLPSPRIIGRGTVDAVQSGIVQGHAFMISGLVEAFRDELGTVDHVLLTGGYAAILAPLLPSVTAHIPSLTLDGLRIVHRRNATPTEIVGVAAER